MRNIETVHIVKASESDAAIRFLAAVDQAILSEASDHTQRVAFDCEGVNLSRVGSVEIISICFTPNEVFLVDAKVMDATILKAVKELFESDKVVKIIHDCRMDSDALFHSHGIKLANVHDTSCFHAKITGRHDSNLNNVLAFNGITENTSRDGSVYKRNPAFWATRPLTQQMIDWASSDVDRLLDVATKQLACISEDKKESAEVQSKEFIAKARDMKVKTGLSVNNVGRFIGKRGANLRSLQNRTGTLVYGSGDDGWFVYYPNDSALRTVECSMREGHDYY